MPKLCNRVLLEMSQKKINTHIIQDRVIYEPTYDLYYAKGIAKI